MSKENKDKKQEMLFNNKRLSILNFFCSACWLISGLLNLDKEVYLIIIDFGLAISCFALGIKYYKNYKNETTK